LGVAKKLEETLMLILLVYLRPQFYTDSIGTNTISIRALNKRMMTHTRKEAGV